MYLSEANIRRGAAMALLLACASTASRHGAAADCRQLLMAQAVNPVRVETLTQRVQRALGGDPNFSAVRIRVQEDDGTVTLSGSVPTTADADRAARIVADIKGVSGVQGRLTVGEVAPAAGTVVPQASGAGAAGSPAGVTSAPGAAGVPTVPGGAGVTGTPGTTGTATTLPPVPSGTAGGTPGTTGAGATGGTGTPAAPGTTGAGATGGTGTPAAQGTTGAGATGGTGAPMTPGTTGAGATGGAGTAGGGR